MRRGTRPIRTVCAVAVGCVVAPSFATAQLPPAPAVEWTAATPTWPASIQDGDADRRPYVAAFTAGATARQPSREPRRARWWAVAASAVVPGAGQALLGESRGVVYAAVEAYTWLQYLEARRFSNRQRSAIRRIARDFARSSVAGARPDGDWDYYERLAKLCISTLPFEVVCTSSGRYDLTPGGEIDPETDIATYNGQQWAAARLTYFDDPDVAPPTNSAQYARAIEYYRARADRPEYAWSWVDQQGPLAQYRNTIASANSAWRDAIRDGNLLIANHVLSTVDAFITIRVRRYATPGTPSGGRGAGAERRGGHGFEARLPWAPFGRPQGPKP